MDKLVFFDLETGGLDFSRPIIELAAIAVDAESFRQLDSISLKIQFDPKECNARSLGKKFDKPSWHDGAIPDSMAADLFGLFLERHATHKAYNSRTKKQFQLAQLIAHHGEQFDGPFLAAWYKRLGIQCPAARMTLCTKQRALFFFRENPSMPSPKNFKLGTLCDYFETEHRPSHHALDDIKATIELYQALMEHSTGLNVEQRDYLAALHQETGLTHQQLINQAINGLVANRELVA